MKNNQLQFSVVREDSRIEERLIEKNKIENVLMICSGGCTALHLLAKFPDLSLTILDPNAAQISLVERKLALLNSTEPKETLLSQFNVDNSDKNGLNQCGNFESLFRNLRFFINEIIVDNNDWEAFFKGNKDGDFLDLVFSNPYWEVAFEIFFSDAHLKTMFGPDAIQHALPRSYPTYFRELFERGLKSENAKNNYFLHHVFTGKYLKHSIPEYLEHRSYNTSNIKFLNGFFTDVTSLKGCQLINFSNIFDWMSDNETKKHLERIRKEADIGCFVIWRHLNNDKDYKELLAPNFEFNLSLEETELKSDRSLFYSKICIGKKIYED